MNHSELKNTLTLNLQKTHGNNIRIFQRFTGMARSYRGDRVFRSSIKGQSDLYGCFIKNKKCFHFEIEIKSSKDSLRPAQEQWKKICNEIHIPWFLFKEGKEDEFYKEFNEWIGGL